MSEARFGALRSAAQAAPSEQSWASLCEALDMWPAPDLEAVAIPYVLGQLKRWPREVERCAPWRWAQAALERSVSPKLLTCDALRLAHMELGPAQVARLAACPHVCHVRALELEGAWVDGWAMTVLAQAGCFTALESLSLEFACGQEGFEELARAEGLGRLHTLNVAGCELERGALVALKEEPLFGQLRVLDMSYNFVEDALRALDGARWPQIERLELVGCCCDDWGAEALAQMEAPRLEMLNLSENALTARGVRALLDAPRLPALRALEVASCQVAEEDAPELLQAAARRGVGLVVAR